MKNITLLLISIFIGINSYAQPFNENSNPQRLFAVNIIPTWTVEGEVKFASAIVPTPIWDENTSYGRCMNNAARTCASSWVCSAGFALTPTAYSLGWSIGCLSQYVFEVRPVIPIKPSF